MAYELLMPKLSSTMAEGTITQWFKQEGDAIAVGEPIFEVMTDKIAIEVESYEEGLLLKRYYAADESAPVNSVIGYIGTADEIVPENPPILNNDEEKSESDSAKNSSSQRTSETNEANVATVSSPVANNGNIRATPAARKLARERDLDLAQIQGSGRNGRIHVSDVQNFVPLSNTFKEKNTSTFIPWKGIRKAVADQMVRSKKEIPHVTMNAEVNMQALVSLRRQLLPKIEADTSYRLSYTEIIIKALTVALRHYPELNARTTTEGIERYSQVHVGLAVALDEGLVVPVIAHADQMNLTDLTRAAKESAQKARTGQLTATDLSGGTITISSLGNTVVRSFNPIINTPEVAILGIGGLYEAPVFVVDRWEMQPKLTLSLSFDHRAVDGAPVASFLNELVDLLEQPYGLLL